MTPPRSLAAAVPGSRTARLPAPSSPAPFPAEFREANDAYDEYVVEYIAPGGAPWPVETARPDGACPFADGRPYASYELRFSVVPAPLDDTGDFSPLELAFFAEGDALADDAAL